MRFSWNYNLSKTQTAGRILKTQSSWLPQKFMLRHQQKSSFHTSFLWQPAEMLLAVFSSMSFNMFNANVFVLFLSIWQIGLAHYHILLYLCFTQRFWNWGCTTDVNISLNFDIWTNVSWANIICWYAGLGHFQQILTEFQNWSINILKLRPPLNEIEIDSQKFKAYGFIKM